MNIAIVYNCMLWDYKAINQAIGLALNHNKNGKIETVYFLEGRGYAEIPSKGSVLRNIKKTYPNVSDVIITSDPKNVDITHYIDIVPRDGWHPVHMVAAGRYHRLVNKELEEEFDWSEE